MTICAKAVLQSDGSYLLGLDPSITDFSACTYVVESGSDFALYSLAGMTVSDATVISSAIVAVWAVAFGFRQLANFFSTRESES